MELVEGPTLGERIKEGAIPLDEAESIAMQVTLALEAAHEKKITHRDLKPGNIKVKPDGVVKVLDFGLAKVGQALPPDTLGEDSPTLTMALTEAGMILGTAAYMAPEQAKGKPVDHRADIWAFGVVLHEMLTGKRLFTGEDLADVLASVVKDQPDLTVVPKRVRKLLHACLQKDPAKRLHSIGDAKLLLVEEEVTAPPVAVKQPSTWPGWAATAAMSVAAGVALWAPWRGAPPERPLAVNIDPPQGKQLGSYQAISPDGRRLFITAAGGLYVRPLASSEFQFIPVSNVRAPFWSADSRFIAFFSDDKLRLVSASGGPVQDLCSDTGLGAGGAWKQDGTILFGSSTGPLRQTKITNGAGSGTCTPVTKYEVGTTRQGDPSFLPDGDHFIYRVNATPEQRGIYLAALSAPTPRKILSENSAAFSVPAAPGEKLSHLLFLRDTVLMAQPFDADAREPVGDPFALLPSVSTNTSGALGSSVSADGLLLYMTGPSRDTQLTWLDRNGKETGKVGSPANQNGYSLSPDGTKAISHIAPDLFTRLHDLTAKSESRFDARDLAGLVWSPDSTRVAYRVGAAIYRNSATGGEEEKLLEPPVISRPSQWTSDNKFLFYTAMDPKNEGDIWYLPNPGGKPGEPVKFLDTPANESQAQLSPDGRWVAYAVWGGPTGGVWVRSFPDGAVKFQVTNIGVEPHWRTDGKELLYTFRDLTSEGRIMAARAILPGATFSMGPQQLLFKLPSPTFTIIETNAYSYAVSADAQEFLVPVPLATREPTLTLITNWHRLFENANKQ